MSTQPKSGDFKKPLSIFEAIHHIEEPKDAIEESTETETEDRKPEPEKYRSEFLFPIKMLF